jgi:hypothetical protein
MKIQLVEKIVDESSEWVIILGSAGAVGSFAVQVLAIPSIQPCDIETDELSS